MKRKQINNQITTTKEKKKKDESLFSHLTFYVSIAKKNISKIKDLIKKNGGKIKRKFDVKVISFIPFNSIFLQNSLNFVIKINNDQNLKKKF